MTQMTILKVSFFARYEELIRILACLRDLKFPYFFRVNNKDAGSTSKSNSQSIEDYFKTFI
jgi:hypothetical protein